MPKGVTVDVAAGRTGGTGGTGAGVAGGGGGVCGKGFALVIFRSSCVG